MIESLTKVEKEILMWLRESPAANLGLIAEPLTEVLKRLTLKGLVKGSRLTAEGQRVEAAIRKEREQLAEPVIQRILELAKEAGVRVHSARVTFYDWIEVYVDQDGVLDNALERSEEFEFVDADRSGYYYRHKGSGFIARIFA